MNTQCPVMFGAAITPARVAIRQEGGAVGFIRNQTALGVLYPAELKGSGPRPGF